jgi:hypothetical protein
MIAGTFCSGAFNDATRRPNALASGFERDLDISRW